MTSFEKFLDYAKTYIQSLDPSEHDLVETPERIISQVEELWMVDLWDSIVDGFSQVYGDEELDKLADKELKCLKHFVYLYAMKYHYPQKTKEFQELLESLKVNS